MKQTYSIDQLATLSGVARRTVRYYIQLGLVAPPEGETRGARYDERHLRQLLEIRKWQEAGLSLERIAEILEGGGRDALPPERPRKPGAVEVWSRLYLGDGLELSIEPGRAGLSPEQVRRLQKEMIAMVAKIRKDAQ